MNILKNIFLILLLVSLMAMSFVMLVETGIIKLDKPLIEKIEVTNLLDKEDNVDKLLEFEYPRIDDDINKAYTLFDGIPYESTKHYFQDTEFQLINGEKNEEDVILFIRDSSKIIKRFNIDNVEGEASEVYELGKKMLPLNASYLGEIVNSRTSEKSIGKFDEKVVVSEIYNSYNYFYYYPTIYGTYGFVEISIHNSEKEKINEKGKYDISPYSLSVFWLDSYAIFDTRNEQLISNMRALWELDYDNDVLFKKPIESSTVNSSFYNSEVVDEIQSESNFISLSVEDLKEKISSGETIFVYFHSPSSEHSKNMINTLSPIVEDLDIKVYQVDVNINDYAWDLFGIEAVPTIIFYEDFFEVNRLIGAASLESTKLFFEEILQ